MSPRPPQPGAWRVRGRVLDLGRRPLLMGVLNVTPDSFSDGGTWLDPGRAAVRGVELVEQGADLLDVGGESTRPGAAPVDEQAELDRILPVVERLTRETDVPLSVDTTKLAVARAALAAGAHAINDVSALRFAPGMAALAAETGAGLVLMHMRGEPRTMQDDPRYGDVVGEVAAELGRAAAEAMAAGVDRSAIVVDPGIGFGKTPADSWRLIARLDRLAVLGHPVLVGHSRKTFLDPERRRPPAERLEESLAAGLLAALAGAAILRVHDVQAHARALAVLTRWREAGDPAQQRSPRPRAGVP